MVIFSFLLFLLFRSSNSGQMTLSRIKCSIVRKIVIEIRSQPIFFCTYLKPDIVSSIKWFEYNATIPSSFAYDQFLDLFLTYLLVIAVALSLSFSLYLSLSLTSLLRKSIFTFFAFTTFIFGSVEKKF